MGEPAAAVDAPRAWAPQPGPQTAFERCAADIAIFGGAAGGGKSFALLLDAVKHTTNPRVRGYRAILFRRTSPELVGGGGLWDESQEMYRAAGGRPRGFPSLDWTFEAGSGRIEDRHRIEFRHLEKEADKFSHQGRQYAFIGFDEVTHFSESQFWYLVSRLRSTCGIRPRLRATCNPDPSSFVADLVSWWIGDDGYPLPERSGVVRWMVRDGGDIAWHESREAALEAHGADCLPISFTFIASRLRDNPALTQSDPGYRAKLRMLPPEERERLLGDEDKGGNWLDFGKSGGFFEKSKFRLADEPPSPAVMTVRFWDKASSVPTPKTPNPDWTRGVRVSLCEDGQFWVDDLASAQAGPADVLRLMRQTAEGDGREVLVGLWRDTAQAGAVDVDTTAAALGDFEVRAIDSWSSDKIGEPNVAAKSSRAKRAFARAWAPRVEEGRVFVKRAPWTSTLLAECDQFPHGRHDDCVDAMSGAMRILQEERGVSLIEAMAKVKIGRHG